MISAIQRRRRVHLPDLAGLALLVLSVALAGCGSIIPKPPTPPTQFLLQDEASAADIIPAAPQPAAPASTLIVHEPRAAAGFDSRKIAYVRTANDLEYFASNEWVDVPSRMLAPLLVRAVERTGAFRAVVQAPSSAVGGLQLDTELIRLQQDFAVTPSRVRLTLRAVLIDTASRRVVASREFNASVVSRSDDPSGGAAAANEAAHLVLVEVAALCAEAAQRPN